MMSRDSLMMLLFLLSLLHTLQSTLSFFLLFFFLLLLLPAAAYDARRIIVLQVGAKFSHPGASTRRLSQSVTFYRRYFVRVRCSKSSHFQTSRMSTEPRERYVARGVEYWLHKKHRDKPEDAKIKYLKSKGLTAVEIERRRS